MGDSSSDDSVSRREFLKAASAGAGAMAVAPASTRETNETLPRRILGKSGDRVPVLGLGTAPLGHRPEKEAIAFVHKCIDSGVTYLDTAPEFAGYGKAQAFLSQVLKERRKEVFLVTKCWEPTAEKALALLKKNLDELKVDRADLVYAHSIGDDRMPPDQVFAADGVLKGLEKAKRDGLTRFAGVSGHCRPERFLRAIRDWDVEVMMNAVGIVPRHIYDFESKVWPEAAKQNVGLAAMKVFGGWSDLEKSAKGAKLPATFHDAAFRYALGIPQVHVVVVGMYDDAELAQNIERVKLFKPLTQAELIELEKPTRELAEKWGHMYGPGD